MFMADGEKAGPCKLKDGVCFEDMMMISLVPIFQIDRIINELLFLLGSCKSRKIC